jgi:anionic cell wall polymer biosynthesis LytR-Cps2A-Psr (LCP) family protein
MGNRPSVDGFVPRRSPGVVGEHHDKSRRLPPADVSGFVRREPLARPVTSPTANRGPQQAQPETGIQRQHNAGGLTRQDVDESLRDIDNNPTPTSNKPPKRPKRFSSGRKKMVKRAVIVLLVVLLGLGLWLGIKALIAGGEVFKGDVFGLIQQKELTMDPNGRSNVLVLGTSEDDPGHQGANLTDSIMVLSIDQKNKNAYMISIPRDLEAKYGRACVSGYAGKVNTYFSCVNEEDSEQAEDERQTAARKFFGDIVGLDIQYSVHVNYTVMRDLVGALGGITVTIESRDPNGQMDSNFDWKCKGGNQYASRATMKKICPPNGHFIDYPNGPVQLDAEHALYLAQARGDAEPTYGFEQSNFDREKNQQKIVVAIKEKALSSGTLTNFGKVTGLVDALGNNLRTNFETSEIRTLVSLAKDIPASGIQSISLIDNKLVNGNAQPTAGLYDYSEIQAFIKKKLNSSPIARESAHVIVLNASGVAGAATTEGDKLSELGMEVDEVGNAPESFSSLTKNTIYQLSSDKPNTLSKLSSRYNATIKTEKPPVTVMGETDFVIILVNPPATDTSL